MKGTLRSAFGGILFIAALFVLFCPVWIYIREEAAIIIVCVWRGCVCFHNNSGVVLLEYAVVVMSGCVLRSTHHLF